MKSKESEIHGSFVLDKNAKAWTPEVAARSIFGVSLNDLIKEIRENRDGKYDGLYINAE